MDAALLAAQAQSPEDSVRQAAERELFSQCERDANFVFKTLTEAGSNSNLSIGDRQFCLLALRKLITMYWSPGFESFQGTDSIDPEIKVQVRTSLLQMAISTQENTKLVRGASYCIVQIAAVDFPDQWPELLNIVFEAVVQRASISALLLLNEIYDDIISEHMFFEEGIAEWTLKIITDVIHGDLPVELQIASLKLCKAFILQLSSWKTNQNESREVFVTLTLDSLTKIFLSLLSKKPTGSIAVSFWDCRTEIYENLIICYESFSKKLFPQPKIHQFAELALIDLQLNVSISTQDEKSLEYLDRGVESFKGSLVRETVQILEFISNIFEDEISPGQIKSLLSSLVVLCQIDNDTQETWLEDYSAFISKESGLQPTYDIRDQTADLLNTLSGAHYQLVTKTVTEQLLHQGADINQWTLTESILFIYQNILMNEEELTEISSNTAQQLISIFHRSIEMNSKNVLLISRLLILIPKYLEKFMDSIPEVKSITAKLFMKSLECAAAENTETLYAAMLISFTHYASFCELPSVIGVSNVQPIQNDLLEIINLLSKDAEEDTYGFLMEVLSHVIDSNVAAQSDTEVLKKEFQTLLMISGKDPANVQVVVESHDCLEKLLNRMSTAEYLHYADMCLPLFVKVLSDSKNQANIYSPLVTLVLEFISVFMKKKPYDGELPGTVANYVIRPLIDILIRDDDDEVLKLAIEALNFLIYNTDITIIKPHLEACVEVLGRLLSIDSAEEGITNVGTLVLTMISKYHEYIEGLMPQILQAVVNKFIASTNVTTQQNLLSIFCYLVGQDIRQTLNFLSELTVNDRNGMIAVLRKWLESFEIIRGAQRIKENIVALKQIYFLDDQRLENFMVKGDIIPYDGDVIITRSMKKKMPDRYTEVKFRTKMVKLFISELSYQSKQESVVVNTREIPPEMREFDASEWEDLDEVLEYEKLKEYATLDDGTGNTYDQDAVNVIAGLDNVSVRELLIEFFKEVASNDVGDFHNIYNELTHTERALITEIIV